MSAPKAAIIHPDYGPSYKPRDTDDLSKFMRRRFGHTEVWCVECSHWHSLELEMMARINVEKDGVRSVAPEGEVRFHCRVCGADVEYIINFNRKRDEVVKEYISLNRTY